MSNRELLFILLRTALWGKEEPLPEIKAMDGASVLKEAEKQTVTALVLDAMDKCEVKLPTDVVLDYFAYFAQVEQDNRQLNAAARSLGRLLKKDCVDYAIVKGQVVASLYPNPLLRQSGDIDFYCDCENISRAKEVMHQSWGIDFDDTDSDIHYHFDYKGVTFELHFSLTSLYNKRKNDYWAQLLRDDKGCEMIIDEIPVKTLSPTLHTLYVFLHLYKHLMDLGVGLRQFCDLAVMLHAYKSEIDLDALKLHLKVLGMEKTFRACGSILVFQLGLPAEEFPYTLTDKDRRYGNRMLDVVFYRGNMGHYNKRNGFHGWKHNLESTGIKVSHFLKFMPLAPSYSCQWLIHELSRKLLLKLKS